MNNIAFFTSICQSVLNPLPITEKEKREIIEREIAMDRDYARDMDAELEAWPPYDFADEL